MVEHLDGRYALIEKVHIATLNEAANVLQRVRPERRVERRVINAFDKPGELLKLIHANVAGNRTSTPALRRA